jgi:hypothetical protein
VNMEFQGRTLRERLGLAQEWWDYRNWEPGVESAKLLPPNPSDFDRAWPKFSVPHRRCVLALSCYFSDEHGLAAIHGLGGLDEAIDFFFGDWRITFRVANNGLPDPLWWRQNFIWMDLFEDVLLWGSVLGRWDILRRLGEYPGPDCRVDDGYRPENLHFFMALGALLREKVECRVKALTGGTAGRSKSCKLASAVLEACLRRDAKSINRTLSVLLERYKRSEFPKHDITKKVCAVGTFFFHWAAKEGVAVTRPESYADHIVRIRGTTFH